MSSTPEWSTVCSVCGAEYDPPGEDKYFQRALDRKRDIMFELPQRVVGWYADPRKKIALCGVCYEVLRTDK